MTSFLALLEQGSTGELRLVPGDVPHVLVDGKRHDLASQPIHPRVLLAATSELLSREEMNELPANRPRIVRHEHGDVTYVIEVGRTPSGISLTIRSRGPNARMSSTPPISTRASGAPPDSKTRTPHPKTISDSSINIEHEDQRKGPATGGARAISITTSTGSGRRIDVLLQGMVLTKASDLHLSAENSPVMRVDGEIKFIKQFPTLASSDIAAMIGEIMTPKAAADFEELHDVDFAYELAGTCRFRVNVFQDRNGVGAVLRHIPMDPLTVEQIGLPKACIDLCNLHQGLVVVTGPTGSGKSTTLAAMVDRMNKTRSDHIITIEQPIEFVHRNNKCLVNQRDVGQHTRSFKSALRAALREDPDIVLVGEMRDLETITMAVEAAETGHLVLGILHTQTAVSTVDRMIDQFPADRRVQIRTMLSESLQGVVAQVLCKKISGGRAAAHEILLGTPEIAALIRDAKTSRIQSVMQASTAQGMATMNDSLFALVQENQIEPREAWLKSTDKSGLLDMFKAANLSTLP